MRILVVTDSYPPLIGGATRSSELIAHAMVRAGHTVNVATCWQDGVPERDVDAMGVAIHRVNGLSLRLPGASTNPYRRVPPPWPDPEMVLRLRRVLREFRPDVVHAYGWLTYSCATAMLGTSTPMVLSARDYGNICALRTLLRHGEICEGPGWGKCLECAGSFYGRPKGALATCGVLLGRGLLRRRTTVLHSVSAFVQQKMERYLLGGTPVIERVIPDFREDAPAGEPDAAVLARLPEAPFILFVGALREVKGIDVLIEAYEQLTDPPPLVLIGTRAPDTPASFPEGVSVIEDVPNATVMAAWDHALFGVAPSTLPEPLGNVIHEAMSRGKPVIGTYPGGHGDMISDGVNGLLVPAGDAQALAAAIRRLSEDAALRERMGEAARTAARPFTASVVLPRFEDLYRETLAAGSA